MRRYLLLGAAWGCASAGSPDPSQNPDGSMTDSVLADAAIDAPVPVMITLSQLTSTTNVAGNSVVCNSGENSWYRVFALSDHGVTNAFNVQSVTFGVQE